ncbi:MAG: D-tyrosyl-tRNA(Tyr) deacylase [Porticoccaceae bacterium]|jgi:D-tyrosyl-tRNA(Tyr) deacylase|nr:D-tyrosyl-tRNA(Tyr) deacylase [Porticoccaceae bacterium]|tara:strand:- start:2654 stop:3091 length:438 start_codon:yes stop_codon:yes gene_type:complete
MKALIQRVSSSQVEVEGNVVGKINKGLLVLIGIEKQDIEIDADKMINKVLSYRVFPDENQKMNLSLKDIKGDILVVSQFTLAADTKSGTRAGFSTAMPPNDAENLYNYFVEKIKAFNLKTECGVFGADMSVSLINDGPVTFLLEV